MPNENIETANEIAQRLRQLGVDPISPKPEHSRRLVEEFVQAFQLTLPCDYRCFLETFGNCLAIHGGVIPMPSPSPMGDEVCIDSFLGFKREDEPGTDIRWLTKIANCAPSAVPIADDLFGNTYYMMCQGKWAGSVLFNDHEGRADWPDEEFFAMFENLDPRIRAYLEMRSRGELELDRDFPPHFYRVASTFSEFVSKIAIDPRYT